MSVTTNEQHDLRTLLEHFSWSGPAQRQDLGAVADALAATCGSASRAYEVVLGRPMDALAAAAPGQELDAQILQLLDSVEFRETILGRVLGLYPQVRRGFFVHVPKTAGTSVTLCLESIEGGYVWWSGWQDPLLTTSADLVGYLDKARARLESGDVQTFWTTGHNSLRDLRRTGLLVPGAQVFSVVRHPVEVVVSQCNYMVSEILARPLAPLHLRWASWLSETQPSHDVEDRAAAARRMLHAPHFGAHYKDVTCHYLGGGSAAEALSSVRAARCRLVQLPQLQQYLAELGATAVLAELNVSPRGRLLVEDLDFSDLTRVLDHLVPEDLKFWSTYGLTPALADLVYSPGE